MVRAMIGLLWFCAALMALQPDASAAKRVALVVGVDRYDNLPASQQLQKASSDAHAMGATLKGLGYDVIEASNVARIDFLRQWQQLLNRVEPGDEAAFFFAGHGVEIGGQNFLLPRDVPHVASGEEEVLKASGLSLGGLLEQMRERKPQVSLYIVDACRDNPFTDSKGRGIGATRGLALVVPPRGTFVMYSASTEESALDRLSDTDPDPNSVYTRTLLPHLKEPGKSITEIAREVRREVNDLALKVNRVQTPAYYDEVIGEFCPAGCETKPVEARPEPLATPAVAPVAASTPPAAPAPQISAAATPEPPPPVVAPAAASAQIAALTPPESAKVTAKIENGSYLRSFGPDQYEQDSIVFSRDGQRILSLADAGYISTIDLKTGAMTELKDVRSLCCQLALSPDGTQMATGDYDGLVVLMDANSGKWVRSFKGHSDAAASIAFSPDGTLLASGSYDKTIRLWEAASGKPVRELKGHTDKIDTVAFAPDGKRLASGSRDDTVKFWDVATGKMIKSLKLKDNIYSIDQLAFSPDGSVLAALVPHRIYLLDAAKGGQLRVLDETDDLGTSFSSLAFSPDGTKLAAGGRANSVSLWEVASGKLLSSFNAGTPNPQNYGSVDSVAFSPDGAALAYVSDDKTVKLWDLGSGKSALLGDSAPLPDNPNRGWLGVAIQNVDEESAKSLGLADTKGALISSTLAEGPASGQLLPGDWVLAVDGERIEDMADFVRKVGARTPGTETSFTVLRNGANREVKVELGVVPKDFGAAVVPAPSDAPKAP